MPCTVPQLQQLVASARAAGASEMQLQTWGADATAMAQRAATLAAIAPDLVVIKVPCTEAGLATASMLRASRIRVTVTGIYAAQQVLLAQAVGAGAFGVNLCMWFGVLLSRLVCEKCS